MNQHAKTTCRRAQGFTLVEILTVVVVMGILSALVVPMLGDTSQRS